MAGFIVIEEGNIIIRSAGFLNKCRVVNYIVIFFLLCPGIPDSSPSICSLSSRSCPPSLIFLDTGQNLKLLTQIADFTSILRTARLRIVFKSVRTWQEINIRNISIFLSANFLGNLIEFYLKLILFAVVFASIAVVAFFLTWELWQI